MYNEEERRLAWQTLYLPVAQFTEMALGPAMVRWIWVGWFPVELSAVMPASRGIKSVFGLSVGSNGIVTGVCRCVRNASEVPYMSHDSITQCPRKRDRYTALSQGCRLRCKTPDLDAALAENTAGCRLLVVFSATPEDNAREYLGHPRTCRDLCAEKGVSDRYSQCDDKHRQRATDRHADPGAALNTQQRDCCRQSSSNMYKILFAISKGRSKAGISRPSSHMLSRFATQNEFTMHDHQVNLSDHIADGRRQPRS